MKFPNPFRRGSNKVDNLQKQLSELRQSHDHLLQSRGNLLNKQFTDQITRPSLASPYMSTDTGAKLAIYPFPLIMIQDMVDNEDSIRIPVESLIREIFKNGIEIIEKWKYKCNNCAKEFQYKPEPEDQVQESKETIDTHSERYGNQADDDEPTASGNSVVTGSGDDVQTTDYMDTTKSTQIKKGYDDKNLLCDECGSRDIRRPDPTHRKVLEKLIKEPVNGNMQTVKDILYQLERDLEVCDNAYLLIMRSYDIDDFTHEVVDTRVVELLRLDPPQVAMIVDSDGRVGYDDNGNRVYVCPRFEHRNKRLITPHCDVCGTRALRAIVEVNSVYSIGIPQPKRVVYGEGEVIWKAGKYKPGLVYGYSPIYAIWSKVMALRGMDEYVRKYFDKMRPPRGMLVIASRNYETFKKSWDALEQKAIEDPYEIWPLLIEADRGGKSMAQWIDFTGSLRELQFIEVRDELRRIIGAMYGVLPLWYGMTPSGWNQEGLQVTITNRIVRWGQEVLYEAFMDKVAKIVGVDDWDMRLKAGEDTDRLRELQIDGAEISNMATIKGMGFPVERTHQGEWKVGLKPIENNPTTEMGADLTSKDPQANKEDEQRFQGDPKAKRPSDIGGKFQGHPGSGENTSLSEKSSKPRRNKKKVMEGETGIIPPSDEARQGEPDYNDPKDTNISDTKDPSVG